MEVSTVRTSWKPMVINTKNTYNLPSLRKQQLTIRNQATRKTELVYSFHKVPMAMAYTSVGAISRIQVSISIVI